MPWWSSSPHWRPRIHPSAEEFAFINNGTLLKHAGVPEFYAQPPSRTVDSGGSGPPWTVPPTPWPPDQCPQMRLPLPKNPQWSRGPPDRWRPSREILSNCCGGLTIAVLHPRHDAQFHGEIRLPPLHSLWQASKNRMKTQTPMIDLEASEME
jgi:hypothetical protein